MALVDDVRQQVAVGNDNFPRRERRPDDFSTNCARAAMYSSISLRRAIGVSPLAESRISRIRSPSSRAARIAANHDIVARARAAVAEQPHLRRFAVAIDAVEGEKHALGVRCQVSAVSELRSGAVNKTDT